MCLCVWDNGREEVGLLIIFPSVWYDQVKIFATKKKNCHGVHDIIYLIIYQACRLTAEYTKCIHGTVKQITVRFLQFRNLSKIKTRKSKYNASRWSMFTGKKTKKKID